MFDNLLGNVFGRSKKQTNTGSNSNNGPNGENSEGFVVLGQQNSQAMGASYQQTGEEQLLYPRMATMLTQEMIVNSSGQSVSAGPSGMAPTVAQRKTDQTYISPIDNIPFSPVYGSGSESYDNILLSESKCLETIERIQQFITTGSQSEYSFHLENTILSESLLS